MSPPPHRNKPHLLAIPYPIHGHITPMLQLCNKLVSKGIAITFAVTERHLANVAHAISLLSSSTEIQLVTVADGLPQILSITNIDAARQVLLAFEDLKHPFQSLLEKLHAQESSLPFTGILSDVHLGWTQDLANSFGLPRIGLWTTSVWELVVYFYVIRSLSEGSFLSFKALPEDESFHIPGLPPLRFIDLPGLVLNEDLSDILFCYFIDQVKRIPEANRILLNTFCDVDRAIIDFLKKQSPNLLPVGPLLLREEDGAVDLDYNPEHLSGEENRCLQWLDTQRASSVLYVSFGSVMPVSSNQFLEVALGLEASQQPFLLVARSTGATRLFPDGFENRLKGRALILSWAPQARVLLHTAVGGFLTHCGWNSILESVCAGVPMLCWPLGADQPLNCKIVVDEWKVGLRLGGRREAVTERGEVERKVRALLCEEEGEMVRRRVEKLKECARGTVTSGGSSFVNLDLFVEEHVQTNSVYSNT